MKKHQRSKKQSHKSSGLTLVNMRGGSPDFKQPLLPGAIATGGKGVHVELPHTSRTSGGREKFWNQETSHWPHHRRKYNNNYHGDEGVNFGHGHGGGFHQPTPVLTPALKKVLADSESSASSFINGIWTPSHSLYEIIVAQDGVFGVNNHKTFKFITKISDTGNKHLDPFMTGRNLGLNLEIPKIPFRAIQLIYSFFFDIFEGVNNTSAESEAMAQVFFCREGWKEKVATFPDEVKQGILEVDEQFFVYIPPQSITSASVTYNRSVDLEANFICALDIHSHDSMSAFFSGIDDNDEQEPRFYGVFGGMPWESKEQPCWVMRYQTKVNGVLQRHSCDFFTIVERPELTMPAEVPASVIQLFRNATFKTQDLLKFAAATLGRVPTDAAILDRCKLNRYTHGYQGKKYQPGRGYEEWSAEDYAEMYGFMGLAGYSPHSQRHRSYQHPQVQDKDKNIYEAEEDHTPFQEEDTSFFRQASAASNPHVEDITKSVEETITEVKEGLTLGGLIDLSKIISTKRGVRTLREEVAKLMEDISRVVESQDFDEDDLALSFEEMKEIYSFEDEEKPETDGIRLQEPEVIIPTDGTVIEPEEVSSEPQPEQLGLAII